MGDVTENKENEGDFMRILIAEDERDLNNLLKKRLEKQKYSVDACFDGRGGGGLPGSYGIRRGDPGYMMPKKNGLEVLKYIRDKKKNTPVLLLTARDSVEDRVTGLDAGADDYLIKPFAFDELLARIRVMLRKNAGAETKTNIIEVADMRVDLNTQKVSAAGKEISLSSREFSILRYLCMNKGIVLSRDKIEEHIWNYDYAGGSNVVDVYIRYLRKKIDEGFSPKLIHTVRGAGYVLREEE